MEKNIEIGYEEEEDLLRIYSKYELLKKKIEFLKKLIKKRP